MAATSAPAGDDFRNSILQGLTSSPKWFASRFLYDAQGDDLFIKIMNLPEYYPARCEQEILQKYRQSILAAIGGSDFSVVELGAGDGKKTKVLLSHFLSAGASFTYMPVDISGHVIDLLCDALRKEMPELRVNGITKDFVTALDDVRQVEGKKLVLFLGATIGNIPRIQVASFLSLVAGQLSQGDMLLVGFDLRKDPNIIYRAYFDSQGVTTAFTMNMLDRINRELGGEFDKDRFMHYPVYDPTTGEMKSYIVSRQQQDVSIKDLGITVHFDEWEPVFTEVSNKYSIGEINMLAQSSGLMVKALYTDSEGYFVDALFFKP
jgi:L-histidine Nalpha-methyltransferase